MSRYTIKSYGECPLMDGEYGCCNHPYAENNLDCKIWPDDEDKGLKFPKDCPLREEHLAVTIDKEEKNVD